MGTLHTGGHRPCLAAGGFTETICGTAGAKNIGVVFRENERGRIYGVTFIDHDRREVFNGSRMGKEFSANVFNDYFKWLETYPKRNGVDIPLQSFGSITVTNPLARSNWRQAFFQWKPIRGITRRKPLHGA